MTEHEPAINYHDAYAVAKATIAAGNQVKSSVKIIAVVAVLSAGYLLMSLGVWGLFGAMGMLLGFAVLALMAHAFGTLIAAAGQMLMAVLETSVNTARMAARSRSAEPGDGSGPSRW